MVNNSTNINKTNNYTSHLKSLITNKYYDMIYDVRNPEVLVWDRHKNLAGNSKVMIKILLSFCFFTI